MAGMAGRGGSLCHVMPVNMVRPQKTLPPMDCGIGRILFTVFWVLPHGLRLRDWLDSERLVGNIQQHLHRSIDNRRLFFPAHPIFAFLWKNFLRRRLSAGGTPGFFDDQAGQDSALD